MSDKKGFNLIELIIVMVVIGILIAVAIPSYTTMVMQGAANAAIKNLTSIYSAEKSYYFTNGGYCTANCNTTANINLSTNLALNINDNNFGYTCTAAGSSYTCTATNNSNSNFTLTLTGPPAQIVLPGGSGTRNPSCTSNISAYCPS